MNKEQKLKRIIALHIRLYSEGPRPKLTESEMEELVDFAADDPAHIEIMMKLGTELSGVDEFAEFEDFKKGLIKPLNPVRVPFKRR